LSNQLTPLLCLEAINHKFHHGQVEILDKLVFFVLWAGYEIGSGIVNKSGPVVADNHISLGLSQD